MPITHTAHKASRSARSMVLLLWLLILLPLASVARVPLYYGENLKDWINATGGGWQAYAFEQTFPQPPVDGCLSPDNPVTIELAGGGTLVVERSGDCPITDGASGAVVANARIEDDELLTLTFDPPIRAFYSYIGSAEPEERVQLRLLDDAGMDIGAQLSRANPTGVQSFGVGFTSPQPVTTIEFTKTDTGAALLGTFIGLGAGETPLEAFGASCLPLAGYPINTLCDMAFSYTLNPVREVEGDVRLWDLLSVDAGVYAFEQDFPRLDPRPPSTCLSGPGEVSITLPDGSATLMLSDNNCPVVSANGSLPADAILPAGETLTLNFTPPIRALYGYYGSLNTGETVTMTLFDSNGLVVSELQTEPSGDSIDASGHGFTSPVPVTTVTLASSEAGITLFGSFARQAPEKSLEDIGFRCSADPSYPNRPLCDLAVAYDTRPETDLIPADGTLQDSFGSAVAISGERLVVGAGAANDESGGAYVFERQPDGSWPRTSELTASDVGQGDAFGIAVAIDGTLAIVGAPDSDDAAPSSGSAYIFERQGSGEWLEVAKLTANDASFRDRFGRAVAISGDVALVGAPNKLLSGAAYVFERQPGGQWQEVTKLTEPSGRASLGFGTSVALEGERALVGAPDQNTPNSKAVVYERDSIGTWTEAATLTGGSIFDDFTDFGVAVALKGDRALIGSPSTGQGSAFLFERQLNGEWTRVDRLPGRDIGFAQDLGRSVALAEDQMLIGSNQFSLNSGVARLLRRQSDGEWVEVAQFTPRDGVPDESYGLRVAIDDQTIVVTAPSAINGVGRASLWEDLEQVDRSSLFSDGFE